jgi:hypothetical protein
MTIGVKVDSGWVNWRQDAGGADNKVSTQVLTSLVSFITYQLLHLLSDLVRDQLNDCIST